MNATLSTFIIAKSGWGAMQIQMQKRFIYEERHNARYCVQLFR